MAVTKKKREVFLQGPRVKVHVTQDIIDNAVESNSAHCVVADAIKSTLAVKQGGRYRSVSVDLAQIRVTDTKLEKRFTYFTPQICQRSIAQFDQGKREWLAPFSFWLQNPVQVVNTRNPRGTEPEAKNKKRSEAGKKGAKITSRRRAKFADRGEGSTSRSRPQKQGGRQIPKSSVLGHRRQYGVKALGNLDSPTA